MSLDTRILEKLSVRVDVTDYVRIIRRAYKDAPLGLGFGRSRFSSPKDMFRLLYLAQDVRTAIAEAIIRDRFQGNARREMIDEEFEDYSIVATRNSDPLVLVDLRHEGASLLGVSTDAVRARAQQAGRRLSQKIYDRTSLDGIVYMSRITNRECVAVYDRAVPKLEAGGPAVELWRLRSFLADLAALHVSVIKQVP